MEEKFSVSLELMIQKFKDKAKQVQDVSKNIASKIKENMSVDVGSNAFSGMTAKSELLLNKINDIKATLEMSKADTNLFGKTEILEMRTELEKLENQYTKMNAKSNMFSASFNKIQSGMDKSLKSAKRFALSLFGIQSAISVISKASMSYATVDEENTQKVQAAWIGLGSMFASIKNIIADFTIKAVSYINIFVKALTGTDFLANAMAKSMNKANKSASKLSKTLAGFDELSNLDTTNEGPSVDTSWIDSFKNVELDPKITTFFENLGNSMRPVISGTKDAINWFKQLDTTVQIFMITLGVAGLIGMLGGTTKLGLVAVMVLVIEVFQGFNDLISGDTTKNIEGLIKVVSGSAGLIFVLELLSGGLSAVNVPLLIAVAGFAALAGGILLVTQNWGQMNTLERVVSVLGLIAVGAAAAAIAVGALQSAWSLGIAAAAIVAGTVAIASAVSNANKRASENMPKLSVGTPYVEKSGYAEIHEGEAVVPKKFNSEEYFSRLGGSNNEQTNRLLEELIDKVEQIEINPYTTIKDVGSASVNYINTQKRVLGRGVI